MENVGNKYNLKAIIAGLLFILFGIAFVLADIFIINHKVIFDYLFKSSYMPV